MKIIVIIALQVCTIILIAWGISIEYEWHADIGYILISAGGLLFAVTEKLDKYRIKRDLRDMSNSHKK
jgi:hypothetical protein